MKRDTLVRKLEEAITENPRKAVTMGEISLALDLLTKAKAQSPSVFAKLNPLINELLEA